MAWTADELLRLVRAWEECLKPPKAGGGKTKKKKKLAVPDLNKAIYRRFEHLSGGSSHRNAHTVVTRKGILQNSYVFIRAFVDDEDVNGNVDWFSLSSSEQRALMKTAGGERVMPMDERVFSALDKFIASEIGIAAKSEKESVSSEATESEVDSSDGDQYQKVLSQNKPTPKESATPRRPAKASGEVRGKASSASTLEEETGEPKEEGLVNPKRRRVAASKVPPSVKEILERQSGGLVGFLEKRAKERAKEHEHSRQEREADQKFWAEETEKDRALLRELFTQD
ncbi:uncharacterized protein IUM83_02408 [Phytophthora cinnamomi]|uniref:uncharacterized protein n=1 Tax=Phytophthora cinnamomi TaxID=4785 RepID=UPI0035594B05|nr:hypothetical protein IUM83_02408 [Phytophthora cinnamomi]